jgi:hypothetical protein
MASGVMPLDPYRRSSVPRLPAFPAVGDGGGASSPVSVASLLAGGSSVAPTAAGAGGAQAGASAGAPGAATVTAQTNPMLDALTTRYGSYLDNLEGNTGRIMDIAGSKLRDAREGGRNALQQSEGFRGVSSSNRLGQYDTATQRGVQGAIADITTAREGTLGNALQGAVGVARAPAELALAEKQFGLQTANAQQANVNNQFNQLMALLNATRQSPIYSGYGTDF